MRSLIAIAGLCSLVAPTFARAQDVEGSKDHPLVSRFPGYYIADYDANDFGSHEFQLDPSGEKSKKAEGKFWHITYQLKEGAKKGGPLEIARNYAAAFTKQGGTKLVEQVDSGGGTMVARVKDTWMQVDINNSGENYMVTIVEEAAMEQKVEFSVAELAAALKDKGSVALYGILFDTGNAMIKPESAQTLAQVGALLKSDPSLRLEIQGHTDNVGNKAANLKLSQDRAASVKAYLVTTQGIAADRLTTAGLGDTKPVADNATDSGRAQNRRVELVKK